jgi:hypothetical protein
VLAATTSRTAEHRPVSPETCWKGMGRNVAPLVLAALKSWLMFHGILLQSKTKYIILRNPILVGYSQLDKADAWRTDSNIKKHCAHSRFLLLNVTYTKT